MARSNARTVGLDAEQIASRYLMRNGATIIASNYRCRLGEIDIVAGDRDCLAFVEVRYRGPGSFSRAGPTVDLRKQKKLIRTAAMYCASDARFSNLVTRFDVVAIDACSDNRYSIEWIKDAFRPADSVL